MLFRWVNSKGAMTDIFSLNPELKNVKEFYGSVQKKIERLTNIEMRFVILVADTQSPCRLLSPENRRASACVLLGLTNDDGIPNDIGKSLMEGRCKNVENAIIYFRNNFSPRSEIMKQEAVETLYKTWGTQRKILEYGEANKLFDKEAMTDMELSNNDVKILAEGNKIIKEGLLQKVIESIALNEQGLDPHPIALSAKQQTELDDFESVDDKDKFSFDKMDFSK